MTIDLSRFQTYRKHQRVTPNAEPNVTIQNTGTITINEFAWQLYGDDQPDAFLLLYDADDGRVGLLPSDQTTAADAYKVNEVGARHSVNARRFVDAYNLPRGREASYTPEYDPETGLLYFTARSGTSGAKTRTKK